MTRILTFVALFCASMAHAAIPSGYYTPLTGKSGAELKNTLYQIISPHSLVSSYSNLPQYFQKTDVYPNSSRWWDMYADIPLYAPSFKGLNREHSLPKSWWGGSTTTPAYTDLNHLYPAEADANMAKSNYPLGVVIPGRETFDNGISKVGTGQNSGGATYVFEPADEYKGDFARTYFYMVTCYQNLTWKYTYMCRDGAYPSLQQWAIDLLLQWHRQDQVSQKELDRNEQVFLVQNNRNPFIDYPELAEYIWGNKKGQAFSPGGTVVTPGKDANLITPPNGMTLDFSQTAAGYTSTAQLQFKGENLMGSLELSVGGLNRSYFTLSTTAVGSAAANATSGTWITVTYTPKTEGEHTANLIITDGGLQEGSRVVKLRGECLPVPVLTTLTATEATSVKDSTYVANWDMPSDPDETVDFYVLTVKKYHGTQCETEELYSENNYMEVDGFEDCDYHTYSVQSSRLGVRSAASNVITVRHTAALQSVFADKPLIVESIGGGKIRFRCSETHPVVYVSDLTGRIVATVADVTDLTEYVLPEGLYLIGAPTLKSPVKVVVR